MKNRKEYDYIIWVEMNTLQDWTEELVCPEYPIFTQINNIKKKTFVALNMSEFDKYQSLTPEGKKEYLKTKKWFEF